VVEMLAMGLDEAARSGYHALTFDGPGQGQALYEQDLFFRHDWEHVITPVVDWAVARDDVDAEAIALAGWSQAGYWIPRAAAFEHRLAAAAVDPGVVKVGTSWTQHFPEELMELYRAGDREQFDGAMQAAGGDPAMATMLAKRMEPYGTDSMFEMLTELEHWDLTDVAKDVRCPVLITDPEDEQFWPGQSRELYDLIEASKNLVRFTAAEGANWHCEPMAPVVRSHRLLDWLDETLGSRRESAA
jgi:dipeptidyl aminopeptidase/acylaminoacyl peptidase